MICKNKQDENINLLVTGSESRETHAFSIIKNSRQADYMVAEKQAEILRGH
jgi:hypothetical protein